MIMAIVMVLTSVPMQAQAAVNTSHLAFRWAKCDANGVHSEDKSVQIETQMNQPAGGGSPVTFYYVDANGNETLLPATDISTSDSSVVSLEYDSDSAYYAI